MVTVMDGMQVDGEGVLGETSFQSIGDIGKDFCPNLFTLFLKILIEGTETKLSSKRPTVSSGVGSYLGVPCRGAL